LANWGRFEQELAKEEPDMDASVRFGTQIIGALPVIVQYFERLGLGAIIDEVVPWEGGVPLGTVTEIMIANRLLNPQALYRIGEWAHKAGLTDYYGVTAEQLNDDLLGRALERLAKYADAIEAALVTRAIKVFKLRVTQIHFDITDVELYGAYEQPLPEGQTAPTPQPAYGRTKSGRKNVKQIGMGLNVTADGGVPIGHLPLNGNAAESPVHLENLRALAKRLGKTDLLYIADTKLDTTDNLLMIAVGMATVHAPGRSDGVGWWARWEWTAAVRYSKALRRCWRQVSITVSIVSTKRLPLALCVPKESLRQMTA
jgi:hypothetical protein